MLAHTHPKCLKPLTHRGKPWSDGRLNHCRQSFSNILSRNLTKKGPKNVHCFTRAPYKPNVSSFGRRGNTGMTVRTPENRQTC